MKLKGRVRGTEEWGMGWKRGEGSDPTGRDHWFEFHSMYYKGFKEDMT